MRFSRSIRIFFFLSFQISLFNSLNEQCPGSSPPVINITSESPPVINITSIIFPGGFSEQEQEAVRISIGEASRKWGFFHVTGHGLEDMQRSLINVMQNFFALPMREKMKIKRNLNNSRGYANDELTKQIRDEKEIFDVGHKPHPLLEDSALENIVLDGYNQYPPENALPNFRRDIESYYRRCAELSAVLLSVISRELGLPENYFEPFFSNHSSFLRLNNYPNNTYVASLSKSESSEGQANVTTPTQQLGISRHTDAGALTLLLQDGVPALEVYSGSKQDVGDGQWVPVLPVDGAFTVNTGDMLQVWTNNRVRAPEHRVLASTTRERMSAAFFYNPSYDATVEPCPALVSAEEPPRYRGFSWGEFRSLRFLGDYGDFGKEVQIENYII